MTQPPPESGQPDHVSSIRRTAKEVHGFDDWPGRDAPALPAPFLPDYGVLDDLALEHRGRMPNTRHAFVDKLTGAAGTRVAVWVHQYPTPADAQEGLVNVLERSMLLRLPSCAERGMEPVGDVCFCGSADPIGFVVFTRASVLVRVQSIGDTPVSVTRTAAELDRQVTAAR
ncbi:hypothetical protein AQ490_05925 [Wenjunlia vitaminophila]|uniref:Uncharacterized protein n=1 Tax=Wenjunlia vitaminophila TaxID=76728 RepID=A0A0T6LPI2_WENVI|nr:hypothetical protein [Wenjunlia vitaminophila]KRV47892.1 hypothetical protein AQ490_05925 [Wenjunlia vitaminophila]